MFTTRYSLPLLACIYATLPALTAAQGIYGDEDEDNSSGGMHFNGMTIGWIAGALIIFILALVFMTRMRKRRLNHIRQEMQKRNSRQQQTHQMSYGPSYALYNPDGSPRFTPPTGFFVRPQTYTAPPPDNEQLPAYEPPKKNAQGQDPGQVV